MKKMPEEISDKGPRVDQRILDAFWKIAEPDCKVRLDNIEVILNTLSLQEAARADDGNAPWDLDYTLKRLITGLASTRKAARQGFAVALSEVLRCFPTTDPNEIVSLVFKLIPISNAVGERSAQVVGQILAFESLIRSGLWVSRPESIPGIVETLLELSDQKTYVEHASCLVLEDLITHTSPSVFREFLWPILKPKLSMGQEKSTPKTLWLLLVCSNIFPDTVSQKFLLKHWNTDKLLKVENYEWFGNVLKQAVNVHPHIHPLCFEIIKQLIKLKSKDFKHAWCLLTEQSLLHLNKFEEAYLLFEIVKLVLPELQDHKMINSVFSDKFRELFIKSMKTRHSPLHMAASQLCDYLSDFVQKCSNAKIQISVLKLFIAAPSTLLFDQITKKTTVQAIVSHLNHDAIQQYAEMLLEVLCDQATNDEQSLVDSLKCHSARELARLVGHPTLEETLKSEIMQKLFLHGFFRVKQETADIPWCSSIIVLSDIVRDSCVVSFKRGLELLQMPPVKKGFQGRLDHQKCILAPLLEYCNILLHSKECVEPIKDVNSLMSPWKKMASMLKKVVRWSMKDGKSEESAIFQIFYLQIGFQLFYDTQGAEKILEELNECCKQSLKVRKSALKCEQVDERSAEPPWPDVVMDLMMSMLSDQSHFMRSLVFSVFPALCPFLTADSMKQLLEAINPVNDENPLENDDDNDDVEFDSGSSSESDDEMEEVNGISEIVDDDFKNKLRDALGHASDEDETYLSDSDMFKLDDAIREAFMMRAQPNRKKEKLKEEQTQNHFRLRCIELLALYIKKDPTLQLTLLTIEPLVTTAKIGLNNKKFEALSMKACNMLNNITNIKKFKDKDSVQQNDLQTLLQFLLTAIQSISDLKLKNIIVRLCSFAVFCSEAVAKTSKVSSKERRKLSEWYLKLCKELIRNYFEKNAFELSPQLIDPLLTACAEHSSELLDILEVTAFENTNRLFKRTQALSLIVSFLQKRGVSIFLDEGYLKKLSTSLLPKAASVLKETVVSTVKPTFTSKLLELILLLLQFDKSVACEDKLKVELSTCVAGISLKKLDKTGKKAARKIRTLVTVTCGKRQSNDDSDANLIPSRKPLKKVKTKENT